MMPANVKSGIQTFAVGHVTRAVDRNFLTRYGGVLSGDRVQISAVMYDVLHVLNVDDAGAEFQLMCSFAE